MNAAVSAVTAQLLPASAVRPAAVAATAAVAPPITAKGARADRSASAAKSGCSARPNTWPAAAMTPSWLLE